MSEHNNIASLLQPQSIAIVGASPKEGTPRHALVKNLLKHGYKGKVYPVSPSNPEIEGLKAYKTVADIPEVPDVALIITPAATVAGIIEECGQKGIYNAVVFSAGFEEVEGGDIHAKALAEAAAKYNVRVIGPNCNGLWSVKHKTIMSFSGAALRIEKINHSPIAVLSQSGALSGAISNALNNSGLGLSYIVSVGNETVTDVLDIADSIIEQDDVKVIALYLEGLEQANRIINIAHRARQRGIQIVALKTGRSAAGQDATASHTGKIASSHVVYADVFAQAGIIEVNSIAEMTTAVEVLAFLNNPRHAADAKGGISVLSVSGGAGALLADHSSEFDLNLAEFGAETMTVLNGILPDFARKSNPIDLTGQVNSVPTLLADSCKAVAADPRSEAIVVQFASTVKRHVDANEAVFKELAKNMPVILSIIGESISQEQRKSFLEAGVLVCPDPHATISALSLLYRRRANEHMAAPAQKDSQTERDFPVSWDETMQFCADSGISPAPYVVMYANDNAANACSKLNFPLVVKVLPSESEHKTELGLVKLRVQSFEEVDTLASQFRAILNKDNAGILVQEMVSGGVEVVMSCLRNTDFGPVISIGSGGVAIELYRDVTHLALPVTEAQVLDAIKSLKLWTLLDGFRGAPKADIDALVSAAVQFGNNFLATPSVSEFEMNPIMVRAAGEGIFTVDALVK
jgi:acyl-CoA synthetase (NDP forming)